MARTYRLVYLYQDEIVGLKKDDAKSFFSIPHNPCFELNFFVLIGKWDGDGNIITVFYQGDGAHGDKGAAEADIFDLGKIGVDIDGELNVGTVRFPVIGSLTFG